MNSNEEEGQRLRYTWSARWGDDSIDPAMETNATEELRLAKPTYVQQVQRRWCVILRTGSVKMAFRYFMLEQWWSSFL